MIFSRGWTWRTRPCRGLAYVLCSMLCTQSQLPTPFRGKLLQGFFPTCSGKSLPPTSMPCTQCFGICPSSFPKVIGDFSQERRDLLEKSEEENPFCDSYHLPTLVPLLSLLHFSSPFSSSSSCIFLLFSSSRHSPILTPVFPDLASKWLSLVHLLPWVQISSWPQLHLELLLCSTLAPLALSWLPLP